MHSIIEEYKLDGEFRWLVAQKDPVRNGEIYRYIAGLHPSMGSEEPIQCILSSSGPLRTTAMPEIL